jgi:tRNA (uracil-5-)-methyltransferase
MLPIRLCAFRPPTFLLSPRTSVLMAQKRAFNEGKRHFKKNKKQKTSTVSDGSNEEVLLADIRRLLKNTNIDEAEKSEPKEQTEIDVEIAEISSTGDGLAHKDGSVIVVPFATPGDTVTAKVYKNNPDQNYALADFVKVVKAGEHRTETPGCGYFTKCSGCQFQHLPYAYQLEHKRTVVERAYQNFSNLPASSVPKVGDTVGSPLIYGYRTKLTPHFDGPPMARKELKNIRMNGQTVNWPAVPNIGFMLKGTRKTMDIEDCPIGTDAVRAGNKRERKRVTENISQYSRGATLLLRENTVKVKKDEMKDTEGTEQDDDTIIEDRGDHIYRKTCITDQRAISSEYIDDYRLDNPAGAFFQNNNSILPLVTKYIRENILGPDADSSSPIKNMIDAYCGSGFFTITLSSMFNQSVGIDISQQSIDFASKNARLNNLPEDSVRFIAGDANALFDTLDKKKFPADETAMVIDPSRKGCDEPFISQLMDYGPKRLCYVSCNVHTQARDVGWLVGGLKDRAGMYEIESVRGFDFFPQTSHVEGVAFLRRVDKKESAESVQQPELPKEGEAVVEAGEEAQASAVEIQKEI